jgi:hypothetical protein
VLRDLTRILMNAQPGDGSPGGAPPPAAVPTPAPPPPAQGDVASLIADQVKNLAPAIVQQVNDAVFANLRRAGVLGEGGGKKPAGGTGTEPPTPATPPPAGDNNRSLLRSFDRATAKLGLSDAAVERMEREFLAERPTDVAGWVKSYLSDFGINQGAATPPAQPPTQQQQPPAPAGAPAAPTPPVPGPAPLGDLDRADLHPNRLTSDQVQRLGPDGTLKYVKEYFAKNGRR